MVLSDCVYCWETPCCCGAVYKDWTVERKVKLASSITGLDKNMLKRAMKFDKAMKEDNYEWNDVVFYIPL